MASWASTAGHRRWRAPEIWGCCEREILELYVVPTFRRTGYGRRLAQVGISHLTGRAGLQVYLDNSAAQRFWPTVLERSGITYRTYGALDRMVPVLKYRFQSGVL